MLSYIVTLPHSSLPLVQACLLKVLSNPNVPSSPKRLLLFYIVNSGCWHLSWSLSSGQVLTERHLKFLLDILKCAAGQWWRIGIGLHFKDCEIKSIENSPTLISRGPVGYLYDMLSQWLKWSPPNHPSPTIENLVHALQYAGEESLAFDLEEKLRSMLINPSQCQLCSWDTTLVFFSSCVQIS